MTTTRDETAAQLDILRHSLGLRAAGGWVLIKGE